MKIRGSHVLWAALALAAGIWAFSQLGSDDARRIHRKLSELEGLIEKSGGETNFAGAAKVRKIGDLLTPEFEIDVVPFSQKITSRQELLGVTMGYRARSKTVGLDLRDEELEIAPGGRSARLAAVAVVAGDDLRRESYRLAVDWVKSGDEWLMRRVEVLEVLEGAPIF